MGKKFIVYGGYVDIYNYVSAYKVAKCYKVNPNECIFVNEEKDIRGINKSDYIPLYFDSKGRYNIRAYLLSIRTPKSYDESYSIIKEYDRIIQKELTDLASSAFVHFVVSNLNEEELKLK